MLILILLSSALRCGGGSSEKPQSWSTLVGGMYGSVQVPVQVKYSTVGSLRWWVGCSTSTCTSYTVPSPTGPKQRATKGNVIAGERRSQPSGWLGKLLEAITTLAHLLFSEQKDWPATTNNQRKIKEKQARSGYFVLLVTWSANQSDFVCCVRSLYDCVVSAHVVAQSVSAPSPSRKSDLDRGSRYR
jgi:hypothetical protein